MRLLSDALKPQYITYINFIFRDGIIIQFPRSVTGQGLQ
ncbi:Uncharacterised protein [Shigella sonnei]|nr:Uncharacterised protein [Shigella sonnei]CSR42935.1 Uncharacterised protein [Shigella sonnei]CSS45275.1 Uncharacterised protein [Shigella sonnei]SRT52603.1 Uncharacterised protein [Shigella sonnei]